MMPENVHICGPKCEIGEVKVHIQSIKDDISDMKATNTRLADILTKTILFEEKFKALEENREHLWKKVNKNEDKLALIEPLKETVDGWKKGMMKLKVGIAVVVIGEIIRVILQLKGIH